MRVGTTILLTSLVLLSLCGGGLASAASGGDSALDVLATGPAGPSWAHAVGDDNAVVDAYASSDTGVISVTMQVDGRVVPAPRMACSGPCEVRQDLSIPTSGLKDGSHEVVLTASGGDGTVRSKRWFVTVDRTAPSLEVGGSLLDERDAAIGSPVSDLHVASSDSGVTASGTRSVRVLVDGHDFASAFADDCKAQPCRVQGTFYYHRGLYGLGEHRISVEAWDLAGNVTSKSWIVGMQQSGAPCTGNVMFRDASCVDSRSACQAGSDSKPAKVAAAGSDSDLGTLVTPVSEQVGNGRLTTKVAASDDGVSSLQTLDPVSVSNATGGITIGSGTGDICLLPDHRPQAATTVNDVAVEYSNDDGSKSMVRPNASGADLVQILRDKSSPTSASWKVALQPGQVLHELPSGDVALVQTPLPTPEDAAPTSRDIDPLHGADPVPTPSHGGLDQEPVGPPAPTDIGLTSVSDSQAMLENAASDLGGEVIGVIGAPRAKDADNDVVPTSLTAHGDALTLRIGTSASNTLYPVVAQAAAADWYIRTHQTWNIRGLRPGGGVNYQAIARYLENATTNGLTEICPYQTQALIGYMFQDGYATQYATDGNGGQCSSGNASFGEATITRDAVSSHSVQALTPYPGGGPRSAQKTIVGLVSGLNTNYAFVTAHTDQNVTQIDQAAAVAYYSGYAQQYLDGDFNATPTDYATSLGRTFMQNEYSLYYETDPYNQPTMGSLKYDYIFFSKNQWYYNYGTPVAGSDAYSDHKALMGTMYVMLK
jgi:hypothetical protein